jgi:phosphoserine phosphatase RsbU/P
VNTVSSSGLAPWRVAVARLARLSQVVQPGRLATAVVEAVSEVGAGVEAGVYLVDREQVSLRALLPHTHAAAPVPIEGTLAGRAFTTIQPVQSPATATLWLPLVDGSDRLGAVELHLPPPLEISDPVVQAGAAEFVRMIGYAVVAKLPYGDSLRRGRRSRPMSVAGELLWRLLPPLTFAAENISLAAIIEPCYDVGGDAFDYAVDDDVARIGIFDAVGHDLNATVTAMLTVSAVRSARAAGLDVAALARAADSALLRYSDQLPFTTAILADIDLVGGVVRYVGAGHPPAVLVRDRKVVATLDRGRRTPLGILDGDCVVGEAVLEPGDRLLLYTDGVTEARDDNGVTFGLDRLVDFVERHDADGLPPPEMLRRLRHAVLRHQNGRLQDDATLMIVEWVPRVGPRAAG